MLAGETRYACSRGLPTLHQTLSDYHRRHWNVDVAPDRFAITSGGMNAIMQACQALLEPGDEVIIPAPAWPNLAEAVRITGGVPVTVAYRRTAGGRFRLLLEDILAAVTPRTRILVVNSPSNPTGWVMPLAEMEALRDAARERGLWVLSDEVYNHFTDGNAIAPSFLQITTPTDRLIVTENFSKNWAMTGRRAGWITYPEGLAGTFGKLGQYNTTSIPTFIQSARLARSAPAPAPPGPAHPPRAAAPLRAPAGVPHAQLHPAAHVQPPQRPGHLLAGTRDRHPAAPAHAPLQPPAPPAYAR
jgi:aspartate/methionine/tyrosine aminotransferase